MRTVSLFASFVIGVGLVACSDRDAEPVGIGTEADVQASHASGQSLYEVVHPGTLGGEESRGQSIGNGGRVAGFSNEPGDLIRRATLWTDVSSGAPPIDLGTLGGDQSNVPLAGLNNNGVVVGISETDEPDPLGQVWSCSIFFEGDPTGNICLGFVWEDGEMRELPTLGGHNGFASAVNNRGQIAGWAETADPDPSCVPERELGFLGVLWEPKKGTVRPLPPLPGHSASAATAINERGQVVGISGDCDQAVGRFSARSGVLWEKDGRVIDLGGLGGVSWHTPWAINERGDVVGFANPPGDEDGGYNGHAFFWTRSEGEMRNLGTLPGNTNSQAHSINNRGQVVGTSFGGEADQHAFIWRDGDEELTDLNSLVEPGYTGVLLDARQISDNGTITGSALDPDTGDVVPFVATPVSGRGAARN